MSDLDTETFQIQNGWQGCRDGTFHPSFFRKNPEHTVLFYEYSERKSNCHVAQTALSSSVTPQVRCMGTFFFFLLETNEA